MMAAMDDEALYLPDGDGFVATLRTQGAWHPDQQHGGPVQALLTRCVQRVPTLVPMQVTRLTFDMVRPVPIGPRLDVTTSVLREGKRIQLVEAVLRVGDIEHVRTQALRLREEDLTDVRGLPASTVDDRTTIPWADDIPLMIPKGVGVLPGFLDGIELRRYEKPGAPEGVFGYWIRLRVPVVTGEEPTPLERLTVAGDFTNTIGVLVDHSVVTTINPDVNVHLLRPPAGEWICVDGDTRFGLATGVGVSTAQLRDRDGVCAVASTSQLVQRR